MDQGRLDKLIKWLPAMQWPDSIWSTKTPIIIPEASLFNEENVKNDKVNCEAEICPKSNLFDRSFICYIFPDFSVSSATRWM